MYWLFWDFALDRFALYGSVNTIVICQYSILQLYLFAKSQESISEELSKTIRTLRSFSFKIHRQIKIELEILSLKILHRNLSDRSSSMFSLDFPFLFEVNCRWIVQLLNCIIWNFCFVDGSNCHQLQPNSGSISSFTINLHLSIMCNP
jgi:hypothetical protein